MARPASESWEEQTNLCRRKQDFKSFLLDQIEKFLKVTSVMISKHIINTKAVPWELYGSCIIFFLFDLMSINRKNAAACTLLNHASHTQLWIDTFGHSVCISISYGLEVKQQYKQWVKDEFLHTSQFQQCSVSLEGGEDEILLRPAEQTGVASCFIYRYHVIGFWPLSHGH